MRFPLVPPLAAPGRIALLALAASLLACGLLLQRDLARPLITLGDTDDAMRLVFVRQLLDGRGWYDQQTLRLQPPVGYWPHWSRFVDGGLASLHALLGLFMPRGAAERWMRTIWPLLWVFPAVLAALVAAARLAAGRPRPPAPRAPRTGLSSLLERPRRPHPLAAPERRVKAADAAVLIGALLLGPALALYGQFRPGRVDHHDIQIVCCLAAFAGLAADSARGGVIAGLATAFGSAVGLEALPFEAAAGAGFAWRFVQDGRRAPLLGYGSALAAGSLVFFAGQTPPTRWGPTACDALAVNLAVPLAAAGAAVALAAWATAGRPAKLRFAAMAGAGALAAGLYLAMDPACLKGPFGEIDPRLKPIWLDHVQEVKPWIWQYRRAPDGALGQMVPAVMGVLAWLWLGFAPGRDEGRRLDPLWLAVGLAMLGAGVLLIQAIRVGAYAQWLATPLVAAALADLAVRFAGGALPGAIALGVVLSPASLTEAAVFVRKGGEPVRAFFKPHPHIPVKAASAKPAASRRRPAPNCFATAPWRSLQTMRPGLVLSEIDMGPFILAHTRMSALRAPYHRLDYGILEGWKALAAPADAGAEQAVRRLGVTYVLDCPSHARHADRGMMRADSLQKRLDAGRAPPWLEPVVKNASLVLYRVRPRG